MARDEKLYAVTIEIGDPKSDVGFLVSGFGYSVEAEGRQCRWMSPKAVLRLPVKTQTVAYLRMALCAPKDQQVAVEVNGRRIASLSLEPEKWVNFRVEVASRAQRKPTEIRLVSVTPGERWGPGATAISQIEVGLRDKGAANAILDQIEVEEKKPKENAYRDNLTRMGQGIDDAKIFWGDIHIHSDFSPCDRGYNMSPEDNLLYARDTAGLDCAAFADHGENLSEEMWAEECKLLDKFNKPGKFVTIPAYEWTSELYGHRNVYYPRTGLPVFGSNDPRSDSPPKLWRRMRELREPVAVIPHHTSKTWFPQNLDYHDPELEPCLEIYSKWGSSEYYGNPHQAAHGMYATAPGLFAQDALARGYRYGFVGGSDGHPLPPGTRGITAFCAPELTREALFDALRSRRVYATTGARIRVGFTLNGHPMGTELVVNQYEIERIYPWRIYAEVCGTAPIEKVELLENNQVIYTETWGLSGGPYAFRFRQIGVDAPQANQHINFCYQPPKLTKFHYSRFYYLRVTQVDRHLAWSSPIWITVRPVETEE